MGFPDSSVGKESTCNAGDLGSIPGSGRSPGDGIGYPVLAQMIKNLPAMQEDSPRGGHGNPLQYSCLENSQGQWSLAGYTVHGVAKSKTQLSD